MLNIGLSALEIALPLSVGFLGVWLVLRTQNDFDLTVEASFTLGAVVCAVCLVHGRNPWLSLVVAIASGAVAGGLTYLLKSLLGLTLVLTSIIVSIGLYSVNLHILGSPNLALPESSVVLDWARWFGVEDRQRADIAVMAVVALAVLVGLWAFLCTEVGLGLRASGSNPEMARAQGVSTNQMLLLALVLGNGLTALSGALIAQQQGFADVNMGVGTLVFGVTAVLLGDTLIRRQSSVGLAIVAVVAGTFVYRLIIAISFDLGLDPSLFKGLTAAIVIVAIAGSRGLEAAVRKSRTQAPRPALSDADAQVGTVRGGHRG